MLGMGGPMRTQTHFLLAHQDVPFGAPILISEPEGWFGGGQIGYNLQSGSVVLGIEVDYQGAHMDDTLTFDVGVSNGVGRIKTEIDSFGSVRGRIGFAI